MVRGALCTTLVWTGCATPVDPGHRSAADPPAEAIAWPRPNPRAPLPTTTPAGLLPALPPPDAPACPGDPSGPWFQDVGPCAGLDAVHVLSAAGDWLLEASSAQVFADFDGDGWLDVFLANPAGLSTLAFGDAAGRFTPQPGTPPAPGLGAVAADFDQDGDRDVLVAGPGEETLLRNDGGALVPAPGPTDPHITLAVSAADVDGDGDLEAYTANYTCRDCGGDTTACAIAGDGLWAEGAGTWDEIAADALTPASRRCGFAFLGLFTDLDGDGDPDLYVINDRGVDQPDSDAGPVLRNALFRNDGPGCGAACFTEIAREAGAELFEDGMGGDSADYDHDGDLDLLLSYTGPPAVLENDGNGLFTDISADIGLTEPTGISGWGVLWLDHDNDGDLDIFLAMTGQNRLYRNDGGFYFDDTDAALPVDAAPSRGVAAGDYDRDGRVDLLVTDPGGAVHLLRNTVDTGHHWLGVRLVGAPGAGGTDALGAVVRVTDTSGRTQLREVKAGVGNGGGSDLGLHFGLGPHTPAEVWVRWPDGVEQPLALQVDAWTVVHR